MIKILDDPILNLILYSTPVEQFSVTGYLKKQTRKKPESSILKRPPYL